jgi:hypothetical protein
MRILFFINIISIILHSVASGQNEIPFVDTTKVWNILEIDVAPTSKVTSIIKFSGDTIWNEINYRKVFQSVDSLQTNWTLYGMIREDTTCKVYFKFLADTSDRLLYDFNAEVGDSLYIPTQINEYPPLIVDSIDILFLSDTPRKRYFLHRGGKNKGMNEIWIEGIGSLYGVIYSGYAGSSGKILELLCFYENDTLIYQNPDYESCFITTYADKNPFSNIKVKIYPNPVTNKFILEVENIHVMNGVIEIFDLGGKNILKINLNKKNQVVLYKNNLSPGLYFYRLSNNDMFIVSGKIIIL